MARAVRVRVVLHCSPNASTYEKKRAYNEMRASFKRQVDDEDVLTTYKQYQQFESKPQKIKRKKKAAEIRRIKELNSRWREHFG